MITRNERQNLHSGKIEIVETIRGFAALAVCLFHISKSNMSFPGSSGIYPILVGKGWVGVEAFFVLSGFIIPYALLKGGYKLKSFGKFLLRRCARIEPPYLISIIVVIILGFISSKFPGFKGEPFTFNFSQSLSHLAYLPEHLGFDWLSPVYWSLEAEFHYYILIGLLLPVLWRNKVTLYFGFAVLLLSSFFIPLTVFKFMPYFIPGIAACAYYVKKISRFEFLGCLFLCVFTAAVLGHPWIMPIIAIGTAIVIVFFEFGNKFTSFLGKISFSLYLIHVPIGGRVINFCGRYIEESWQAWLAIIFSVCVCIFSAWIFYKLIERPSQFLSRKISY